MASTPTSDIIVDQDAKIVESTRKIVHALNLHCSTVESKYYEVEHGPVLSFAMAERYVTAKKLLALLEQDLGVADKKPTMSYNYGVRGYLSRSIDGKIEAAERVLNEPRKRGQRKTLTEADKKVITRKTLEGQDLINLLLALFQFELADTVTELIEEARRSNPDDSFRVVELKRLCVERLVVLFNM